MTIKYCFPYSLPQWQCRVEQDAESDWPSSGELSGPCGPAWAQISTLKGARRKHLKRGGPFKTYAQSVQTRVPEASCKPCVVQSTLEKKMKPRYNENSPYSLSAAPHPLFSQRMLIGQVILHYSRQSFLRWICVIVDSAVWMSEGGFADTKDAFSNKDHSVKRGTFLKSEFIKS